LKPAPALSPALQTTLAILAELIGNILSEEFPT
jgi:hypothetical protein